MKNFLITIIDKEGNQKKIGCQSENINTAVGYATSQIQMPFTVVSVEELGVAPDDRLTPLERLILKNTNKKYKYIARDRDGSLKLFTKYPQKGACRWILINSAEEDRMYIDEFSKFFQNIKWEDDEPYKFR